MVLRTTNATTIQVATKVRTRIGVEFTEILPLIQLNTQKSLEQAEKKLKFIYKLIQTFIVDEKGNLFSSDKIALEDLARDVIGLVSEFNKIDKVERLERAAGFQRRAAILLAT